MLIPNDDSRGNTLEVKQHLAFQVFDYTKMVRPERFELPTAWFVARYSIQLSYGRVRNGILPDMAYARQSFRLSCKKAIACPKHWNPMKITGIPVNGGE